MTKHPLLAPALLLITFSATAQITIDQNDFANAGESVFLSTGQNNPFLNFAATGPNSTWNFTNLRSTGQQRVDYLDVSSTNIVYALFYANVFFNPNRANIALSGTDIPFSNALGATDPYTFYYKNSSMYKKVGYGAGIAGLPVSIPMTTPDTIYNFPMNYGNAHTTSSGYSTGIQGILTTYYNQTRTTTVDGWGSLTTSYGTYDVLRTKSEIQGSDSVYVDSLNFGLNVPRSKVTEYKWIAKGEDVPLLQINTTTLFGTEIVSLILFKDRELKIVVDSFPGVYCPGRQLAVYYTATGTFNPAAFLQQGNRFTVQLSDNSGSFANPRNIGNVTSTTSGSISVTIPGNVTGGSGYRIRIVSSSPADTSAVSVPFTINVPPTATITASGPTTICIGGSVELVASSGSGYSYQWKADGADISGATAQTYFASSAGNYTVAITNVCATTSSQPIAVTESPEPVHSLSPSSLETCDGSPVTIMAFNTSGVVPVTYQWYSGSDTIPGATDSTILITTTGSYTLLVTNSDGCTFASDTQHIVIDSVHTPIIYASGSTYFCPGGSVTLSTDSNPELNYQWQKNGVNISGANSFRLTVTVGGTYTVVASDSCDSAVSSVQTVVVTPRPVHTLVPSAPASCDGTPITITAHNTSAASPVWLQWYANGIAIPGAVDSMLTVTMPGSYSLEVIDGTGCIYTSPPQVITFDSLAAPIIYENGSTSFCEGGSVLLFTDSNRLYAYQWQKDGIDIPGADEYKYTADETGIFSVMISLGGNCHATSTQTSVTTYPQPPAPVIYESSSSSFCAGDSVMLYTDTSFSYTYKWRRDGTDIPGANEYSYVAMAGGNYTVVITAATGCSSSSGIKKVNVYPQPAAPVITQRGDTLTSSSASAYQWSVDGNVIPGANTQSIRPAAAGNYTVEITDASGCTAVSQAFYFEGTGVNDMVAGNWHLTVNPNPVAGSELVIQSSVLLTDLQIFDPAGALVYQSRHAPVTHLKLRKLMIQPGVYFVKVMSGKEARVVKVIKM